MKVIRTRQDQLFLDGIKEELASRGQMLVSINDGGFPAYHKGWTCKTFLTTPVRLCVVPKPGMDTMRGSGVCVRAPKLSMCLGTQVQDVGLHSAYIQNVHNRLLDRLIPQLSKCNNATKVCFRAAS